MQNPDAEHRTCTASQYTQLHEKHNAQYKNKYFNSHSAKHNWKNKKNCYRYHSSSQRSLSPFWFQLSTIFSSFIGRDFAWDSEDTFYGFWFTLLCFFAKQQLFKKWRIKSSELKTVSLSRIARENLDDETMYYNDKNPETFEYIECMRNDSAERFAFSFKYRNTQFRTQKNSVYFGWKRKIHHSWLHWSIQNGSGTLNVPMFYIFYSMLFLTS